MFDSGTVGQLSNAPGNLGNLHLLQGELDKAEEMHKKSLEINQRLDRQEGMAADNSNLGEVAKLRGDRRTPREMWTKSLELYRTVGIPQKVSQIQGLLDGLDETPPQSEAKK